MHSNSHSAKISCLEEEGANFPAVPSGRPGRNCRNTKEASSPEHKRARKTSNHMLAEWRQGAQKLGYKPSGYCFGFSEAGFSSADLAVVDLGFGTAEAMIAFGCQKSAATLTISSVGLLSSGEKR